MSHGRDSLPSASASKDFCLPRSERRRSRCAGPGMSRIASVGLCTASCYFAPFEMPALPFPPPGMARARTLLTFFFALKRCKLDSSGSPFGDGLTFVIRTLIGLGSRIVGPAVKTETAAKWIACADNTSKLGNKWQWCFVKKITPSTVRFAEATSISCTANFFILASPDSLRASPENIKTCIASY